MKTEKLPGLNNSHKIMLLRKYYDEARRLYFRSMRMASKYADKMEAYEKRIEQLKIQEIEKNNY